MAQLEQSTRAGPVAQRGGGERRPQVDTGRLYLKAKGTQKSLGQGRDLVRFGLGDGAWLSGRGLPGRGQSGVEGSQPSEGRAPGREQPSREAHR